MRFELNRDRLSVLHQIATTINSILDYKELLERIMDLCLEALNAERGVIVLKEKDDFVPVTARDKRSGDLADIKRISRSVIEEVLRTEKPILLHNALESEFGAKESVILSRIQSVLACPLKKRDALIGAIYCDSLSQKGLFTQEDLEFLIAFSNLCAIAIENARFREMLLDENLYLRREIASLYAFENIIGQSEKMLEIFSLLRKIITTDVNVLIYGESGTGKELVAKAIHYSSWRRKKKFVPIYCGSLPESLLESELFGYKKGSFTGALSDKKGLIEEADGGTLFLDEVVDIPLSVQAKILRFLQEGEIRRIGEGEPRKVDCRIIAASNRDLKEEIKKKTFREDLFYRLNVLTITLPPLRERGEDSILLAKYFVEKYGEKFNKPIQGISPSALNLIRTYPWPGNVRELENAIARAVSLAEGEIIKPEDLKLEISAKEGKQDESLKMTLRATEREKIIAAIRRCGGNKSEAAKILGISRRTLYYKMDELGIKDEDLFR
ncbi:MAG: sigma-54-dependent Fis family transcriptional regulator [candidate division WOR-3 bacterium]